MLIFIYVNAAYLVISALLFNVFIENVHIKITLKVHI